MANLVAFGIVLWIIFLIAKAISKAANHGTKKKEANELVDLRVENALLKERLAKALDELAIERTRDKQ